MNKKGEFL